MRIIIAVSSLHSGGAERVACTLANAWTARGDEVTVVATFSGGGNCFYPLSAGVRVTYLAHLISSKKKSLVNRLQRLLAYRDLLLELRPDVLVSFLPEVNIASVIASIGCNVPVIVCERSDPFQWKLTWRARWIRKVAYQRASAMTVQTEAVARRVPEAFPAVKKLHVLANPIPEALHQHTGHGPDERPSAGGRRRLIAMGRLAPEKQFDVLIRVFSEIARHQPEWDLHIFGEGPLRDSLIAQIEGAGLVGRAILEGATRSPWNEMCASDVFVMTSRIEGFPNALLEAMALGLPCISFDCPSGPMEITRNGNDALLIPLNDENALEQAIVGLMKDEGLRKSLGMRAQQSVFNRYNLGAVLRQWDRLFDEVLTAQPRPAILPSLNENEGSGQ